MKDKKKERSRGRSSSRKEGKRAQTPPKGTAGAAVPSALVARCRGLRFDPTPTTITFKIEKGKVLDELPPIVRDPDHRHKQKHPVALAERRARFRAKCLSRSLKTQTAD